MPETNMSPNVFAVLVKSRTSCSHGRGVKWVNKCHNALNHYSCESCQNEILQLFDCIVFILFDVVCGICNADHTGTSQL